MRGREQLVCSSSQSEKEVKVSSFWCGDNARRERRGDLEKGPSIYTFCRALQQRIKVGKRHCKFAGHPCSVSLLFDPSIPPRFDHANPGAAASSQGAQP